MATLKIGNGGIGSMSVGGFEDADLLDYLQAFRSAIEEGRAGIWLAIAPREADEELELAAEGEGLTWVPVSVAAHFIFDGEVPEGWSAEDMPTGTKADA